MTGFIRWVLFIFVGFPLQVVFNIIYPILHLVWRFKYFSYVEPKDRPLPEYENPAVTPHHSSIRELYFRDSTDDHNALEQYGIFSQKQIECGTKGLELLVYDDGAFLRRFYQGRPEGYRTSGDAVVCWCFAYSLMRAEQKPRETLRKAAKHYLRNLGAKSNMWTAAGWVSARCNNFGINYCPDGAYGLGQPMAGPQFWTNSAVFALMSKEFGGVWKLIFWLHFWLMGGPLWVFSPVLYLPRDKLGYVRDIVMRALWCHLDVFGKKWWVTYPMRFIADFIAEGTPALHEAMLGRDASKPLPQVMHAWHSQGLDGRSFGDGDIWTAPAIEQVRRRAKELGLS